MIFFLSSIHLSFKNINATGFRALEPGQEVEFIGTEGEKGLEAKVRHLNKTFSFLK